MKSCLVLFFVAITDVYCRDCGCKNMRPCYEEMLTKLTTSDNEVECIEKASIGTSTLHIFFEALKTFCGDFVKICTNHTTYEGRNLYEVIIDANREVKSKPTVLLDCGQQAGTEPVRFCLYVIQQLLSCLDYNSMISKVKWVILPSTNPDGLEYSRIDHPEWTKNLRPFKDGMAYGVDISRNFDTQWRKCAKVNAFSQVYDGPEAASENETKFIKDAISKHKNNLKIYLSIRRDGHAILYPYAHSKDAINNLNESATLAGDIALKVNKKSGGLQIFHNSSIFNRNGYEICGHSVDFAFEQGVTHAYEMKVFMGSSNNIVSEFSALPKNFENTLLFAYFGVIKDLYKALITPTSKKGTKQ